ncbi:FRG domain-containing protein [Sphingomonas sp. GC_Shp_2]|nr:FRG domain-containing protein [Sphingomonas sp. GC_Shp_2]
MAGDDSDWAVEEGEPHQDSFPLSRYLEYTDQDLEDALKPVSAETLDALEGQDAIFMSELKGDDAGDYVTMRLGRLSGLSVARGRIHYGFVIERDLGEVPLGDRTAFEAALDLGRWELTRTHWAVKPGDLGKALAKLGLDGPSLPSASTPITRAPTADDQPVVNNVEEYLRFILAQRNGDYDEAFYRGHTDRSYRLEPSLFRKNSSGEYRFLRKEAYLIRELLTAHPTDFAADRYMIDKLVRMQHYGLPTRLLDVTSNPLVALYFCCSDALNSQDDQESDGEVIILSTPRDEIKFFDSDTVSCIANMAMLEDGDKNRLQTSVSQNDFIETMEARRLLHVIGEEKPYFKPDIVPGDLERIIFVKGRITNSRISSQAGAFLLFGHNAILPETGHSSLNIRRVTVRNKRNILDQLARLNIRSSTIYPGIDRTASEIARQHEDGG